MSKSSKIKLVTAVAYFGLLAVLVGIFARLLKIRFINVEARNIIFVIGFALMFLGALWRVILDMNDQDSESSESSSD